MFENYRVFETELAGRPLVVETGKIALSGMASDLLQSEAVQKAYLGM